MVNEAYKSLISGTSNVVYKNELNEICINYSTFIPFTIIINTHEETP